LKLLKIDVDEAIELLNCCNETYVQLESDGSFKVPSGYSAIASFKAKALTNLEWFGFIIENEKKVIVAFRGTKSDLDWLADLKIEQTEFPYCNGCGLVHAGFLSIYSSVRNELLTILKAVDSKKKLCITGHSLGGALATLLGFDLALQKIFPSLSVYTFGMPKIGNREFKHKYDECVYNSFRIANLYDVVPLLPPYSIEYKPLHIQFEYVQVKHGKTFAVSTGSMVKNHKIEAYFEGLEKMKINNEYTPTYSFKFRDEEQQMKDST